MVWIRNNKFTTAFIAVMVIGVGILGYLLSDSLGRYNQVAGEYDTQVKELKRLQELDPYPSQEHLTQYQTVRTNYLQAVDQLQNKLAGFEPAPENPPLTPTQFQDRLREVVDDVSKAARQLGIVLGDDFYMGFERYRSSLPEPGATAALTAQLENVKQLVGILVKEHVETIKNPKRALLPQETGAAAAIAAPTPRPGQPKTATPVGELVSRSPVVLEFSGPPTAFRAVLNDITQSERLFVIRSLTITNQNDKGPVRGQDAPLGGVAPQPAAPTETTPGEPLPEKGPPPLRYVVGQEKVNVTMRVELTRVAPKR